MSDNVKQLRPEGHYAMEAEIDDRIKLLIHEYDGRISLVAVLGILELVKADLIRNT